jgi:hypothetical protein
MRGIGLRWSFSMRILVSFYVEGTGGTTVKGSVDVACQPL